VWFVQRRATPWAEAGFEVAREQLVIPQPKRSKAARKTSPDAAVQMNSGNEGLIITADDVTFVFDPHEGQLTSFSFNGTELLAQSPQGNLWRAATDNDGIKHWTGQQDKPLGRWRAMGLDRQSWDIRGVGKPRRLRGGVVIDVEAVLTGTTTDGKTHTLADHRLRYRFLPEGLLVLDNTLVLADGVEDVPRIGLALQLPPGFEQVEWLGRGPHECYRDRSASAPVGRYQSTVTDIYVPYILPQEHGGRCDVRWVALSDGRTGLAAAGAREFEFTASHFTRDDLFAARHTPDLSPRPETMLYLDHLQRGLGTRSCGPDTLPQYRIKNGKYRFSFVLAGFNVRKHDAGALMRDAVQ
jgi:beta-galactosidase